MLAVATAMAVFVFTRLRGQIPAYIELHRWLAAVGVPDALRNLDGSLLLAVSCLCAARIAWGRGGVCRGLGLAASFPAAFGFALASGLPMLLQAGITSSGIRLDSDIARGVLLAPVVEELFFRAVLVGITVRVGGRAFWPVAVLAAAIFGSVHVPWTSAFGSQHIGVLAATMAGGIWYAWILRSYDWNLWVTILLHAVMNGAWTIFGVADSAAGGLWPNVGRGLTIAVGTALAIGRLRRSARPSAAID
jgi:membrane protease YdiL (CAAX protease family)